MSKEEQERLEDYLELERYLEQVQAGQPATFPEDMTPQQAELFRMALLFSSSSPGASEPRPEFAARLKDQLLAQIAAQQTEGDVGQPVAEPAVEPAVMHEQVVEEPVSPVRLEEASKKQDRRRNAAALSRRKLLVGGAAVAASMVAGAGIERGLTQNPPPPPSPGHPSYSDTPLVGHIPSAWHLAGRIEQVGNEAIRFVTAAVVGYIIRNDDGEFIAFSAACTHMGCLVQWQGKGREFVCPCHGGTFDEYGDPQPGKHPGLYLTSLPRLDTKVEHGNIYVRVPAATQSEE